MRQLANIAGERMKSIARTSAAERNMSGNTEMTDALQAITVHNVALAVEFNGLQGDVVDGDRLLSIRHFSVPAHVSLRCGSSSNRFHTFARDIHELLSMRASPDTRALPDTCT